MKIGIDARFYGGEQSKGLGRYTQKLVEHLALLNTKHEYIIFLQEQQFRTWNITNPRFTPVRAPYRWYTLAEQVFMPGVIARSGVNFMHFPHFNVPIFYRGPFVVTIHDLIILHFPTERATTLGPLLYKGKHFAGLLVLRHAARRAKKIITVSDYSKKDIIKTFHCDPDRIAVTYEGVDRNVITTSTTHDAETLRRYRITEPYFLYVGNAYPHKNLESLLVALQRIQKTATLSFRIVMVGREDYFYRRLKEEAQECGIAAFVIFPGFVSDSDLAVLYRHAVAYLFPSFAEGFGLPALEAMHYGTPVVAARASSLPEILGDAAFYFDPRDISGIIDALHLLLRDPEKRRELIRRGYERKQRFSWEKMAQQTLRIYDEFPLTISKKHPRH